MVVPQAVAIAIATVLVTLGIEGCNAQKEIEKEAKKDEEAWSRAVEILGRSKITKRARVVSTREKKGTSAEIVFESKDNKNVRIWYFIDLKKKKIHYKYLLKDGGTWTPQKKWTPSTPSKVIKDLEAEQLVQKLMPKTLAKATA